MEVAGLIGRNNLPFVIELCRQLTRCKDAIGLAGNSVNNLSVGRSIERDRTILVIEYGFKMSCADRGLTRRLFANDFRRPTGSNGFLQSAAILYGKIQCYCVQLL